MKISFKIVLACLCAASSMNGFSQLQIQQYFRPSLHGGISNIHYSTDDISSKLFAPSSIGGGVTAEYIVFFNQYVGASAGVGVSMFQSKFELNNTLNDVLPNYVAGNEVASDFVYNAQFDKWEEEQMIHTVDIPVGAVGKYSFSDKITAMAGLGVKFQLPVKATYKVAESSARTSTGYFQEANVVVKEVPHQGFYTLNGGQEGDLNTKTIAFAAYLDLGVMQKIGSQHIYYGVYGQYGFTQINVEADNAFLTQFGPYESPLNTTAIEKSRLLSFGIKLGYVLPVKSEPTETDIIEEDMTNASEIEETSTSADEPSIDNVESDGKASSLKPEREEHPYTTVKSDETASMSMESKDTVETETSDVNQEEPVEKESVFKHIFGKFKKKNKQED